MTRIQGYVEEIVVIMEGDTQITKYSNYNIVAGDGLMSINDGTSEKIYATPEREIGEDYPDCKGFLNTGDVSCDCQIWGDVNNDCLVTLFKYLLKADMSKKVKNNLKIFI